MVSGRKLLLADDSVTIQKVIDLTFGDEGIEVTTVSNGEQAISKLEEIQPDIVLADIFMPGRSGYEVCEHIKRDERFRHIPVVLLVGSFEPFDEAEARRVGADDYLTKPFQSIRQLVNKVTALLSGAGSEGEATTRELDLPKETVEQETQPRPQNQESADDIHTVDTAPLPTGGEAERMMDGARMSGHESRDDEMIEARPAKQMSERRNTIDSPDTRATAPLSPADLEEAGIKPQAQPQYEQFQETIRDFKFDEMNEEPEPTAPPASPPAQYMNRAAAADEALLDLGEIEPPSATAEADDFILDLQDEAPATHPERPAPEFSAASSPRPEASWPRAEMSAPAPSADLTDAIADATTIREYDEVMTGAATEAAEATEAPDESQGSAETAVAETSSMGEASGSSPAFQEAALESYEPQYFSGSATGAADRGLPETMRAEEETASVAEDGAQPSISEGGAQPAARSGLITLDQLSPEVIDAIARRAVEQLSTKVVEEIAWEVVPHLAELLIKRKLEEEKSQAQ